MLIELARLVEHLVGHTQLAQIVQEAGHLNLVAVLGTDPHFSASIAGQTRHPQGSPTAHREAETAKAHRG